MDEKRILGVDYGDARTGLALSDLSGTLASGIGTIQSKNFLVTAQSVYETAQKHNVKTVVLGNPINMNGTEGPRCEKIKDFKAKIEELSGGTLTVVLYDERLSTCSAHVILNMTGTGGQKRKKIIDEMSACLILQSYLDRERNKNG